MLRFETHCSFETATIWIESVRVCVCSLNCVFVCACVSLCVLKWLKIINKSCTNRQKRKKYVGRPDGNTIIIQLNLIIREFKYLTDDLSTLNLCIRMK